MWQLWIVYGKRHEGKGLIYGKLDKKKKKKQTVLQCDLFSVCNDESDGFFFYIDTSSECTPKNISKIKTKMKTEVDAYQHVIKKNNNEISFFYKP